MADLSRNKKITSGPNSDTGQDEPDIVLRYNAIVLMAPAIAWSRREVRKVGHFADHGEFRDMSAAGES
jgi:hypothetical protein